MQFRDQYPTISRAVAVIAAGVALGVTTSGCRGLGTTEGVTWGEWGGSSVDFPAGTRVSEQPFGDTCAIVANAANLRPETVHGDAARPEAEAFGVTANAVREVSGPAGDAKPCDPNAATLYLNVR